MTGRNVDLVLGMTMKDFLEANNRAYVEYSKTKSKIEKNPIAMKVGGKDFDMMSMRINSVGNAFQSLGTEIKPVIGLLTQSNLSTQNLSQAFVGLSDMGLRAFQMMGVLKVGINGLKAALGPLGWVMLGLTAVSTAFGIYASKADEAADKQEKFNKQFDKFADQLEKIKKLHDVNRLKEELAMTESIMLRAREENNKKLYDETLKYNSMIKAALKDISDWELLRVTGLTQKKVEELNKAKESEMKKASDLMDYQYQTNRISLFEYIQYLRAHEGEVAKHYGVLSIEYLKYMDNINSKKNELLTDQINNQKKLTANFKTQQGKRSSEQIKTTTVTVKKTKDENKELYDFMENKGLAVSNLLESAFVNQFQNGVPAMKAFGRAFEQMIAQMAISIMSRAAIWGILNLITSGSFGIGKSFLGFIGLGGGEAAGKAAGGRITSSDVARSAFTPSGEDGLIGVQIGETVVNKRATQMFQPVLDKINEIGRYGYAKGGTVADTGVMPNAGFNNQGLFDIVDAIRNIQINIKADLDAISFLRENYPRYQRVINKNRI